MGKPEQNGSEGSGPSALRKVLSERVSVYFCKDGAGRRRIAVFLQASRSQETALALGPTRATSESAGIGLVRCLVPQGGIVRAKRCRGLRGKLQKNRNVSPETKKRSLPNQCYCILCAE